MRLDEQEWWGSAFENGVEVQSGTQPANFVRVWRENFHQGLEHQRTVQNAGMNGSNGLSSEVNFIPQKIKEKVRKGVMPSTVQGQCRPPSELYQRGQRPVPPCAVCQQSGNSEQPPLCTVYRHPGTSEQPPLSEFHF